ncbi:MAG: carbohydrate ABC transporter permease [Caldilineaceae bacterium]
MAQQSLATNYRRRNQIGNVLKHVVINFFVLIILIPLAWVLLLSVKSIPDAYTGALWPEQFDFTHYAYVLDKIETLPAYNLFNSIYVTLATVLITAVCAVLGGYALVHLEVPGRKFVVFGLVASLYFPVRVVSLISIFEIQRNLGLINTTSGLIFALRDVEPGHQYFDHAQHLRADPHRTHGAQRIDGCGAWRTLLQVALPLITNGLVVVLIVNFVTAGRIPARRHVDQRSGRAHAAGSARLCPRQRRDQWPGRASPLSTSS